MSYITATEIRKFVSLPSEITDSQLTDLIPYCTSILNSDINTKIIREEPKWIDETRENDIDGSNKTYYVQNWKNWYLGDLDNDGDIDIGDVIVIERDASDVESSKTVSSVSHNEGKIVLSTAPASGNEVFITYSRAPIDESTPDNMIKVAMAQLVASYVFLRIDAQKIAKFRIGKVSITKQSEGFEYFHAQYDKTLNRIRDKFFEAEEGEVLIESV